MNVLSGAVWKGTKLRLGEAKPDFKERYASEKNLNNFAHFILQDFPRKSRCYGRTTDEEA